MKKEVEKTEKNEVLAKRDFKTRFNKLNFSVKKGEKIEISELPEVFVNNLKTEKVI